MAAGTTYEPIGTTVLNSTQATIIFSDISQNYTDLVLVGSRKFSNLGTGVQNTHVTFNNDTSANYSVTYFLNGPSTGRFANFNNLLTSAGGNEISDRYSIDIWNIFNYSNTSTYKSCIMTHAYGNQMLQNFVGLWRSTSAINRLDISASGGAVYAIGSKFTLYGIAAA